MKKLLHTVIACAFCGQAVLAGEIRDRWVYVAENMKSEASLQSFSNVVATASANGMNAVALAFDADYCHVFKPDRLARLIRAREIADSFGVEIVPLVCNVGYGAAMYDNVNLLESEEIADLRYVAGDGCARFVPQGGNRLANGGMEDAGADGAVAGWTTDLPGTLVSRDTEVKRSGGASLRFEPRHEPGSPLREIRHGMARAYQMRLGVTPGRRYRLSAWVRTENVEKPDGIQLQVYDAGGKSPYYTDAWTGDACDGARADSRWCKAAGTMDWRQLRVDFTAGGTNSVTVYIGSWGVPSGRYWMDDADLVEIGHRNVVTNEGCRVSVRNARTGVTYAEGRDFLPLGVYRKGERVWRTTDEEPVLPLPVGTAIRPGDELLVSAYTPVVVDSRQWVCCMSHPGLYDFFRKGLTAVNEALRPRKWFLSLDEIRAGGSCGLCRASGKCQARILGECVGKLRGIIRELTPDAEIYVWHDMFDPKHNAVDGYCLAKSTYRGSWRYLPKDIIVSVWGSVRRAGSLKFFAGEGFRTHAACYYDKDIEGDLRAWAEICRATDGCVGLMYTSWRSDLSLLPVFAEATEAGK